MTKPCTFIIFTFAFFFVSCNDDIRKEVNQYEILDTVNNDSRDTITQLSNKDKYSTNECQCDFKNEFDHRQDTDLTFNRRSWDKEKEDFLELRKDSIVKAVKSLKIIGFDTIPNELSILVNVERVYVSSRNGITGLDFFPKMTILKF